MHIMTSVKARKLKRLPVFSAMTHQTSAGLWFLDNVICLVTSSIFKLFIERLKSLKCPHKFQILTLKIMMRTGDPELLLKDSVICVASRIIHIFIYTLCICVCMCACVVFDLKISTQLFCLGGKTQKRTKTCTNTFLHKYS